VGQGSFDIANGKFTLHLSLRYEVPPDQIQAELAPWQAAFNRASQMLYNATAGQMQFGTIYVSNTSAGAEEADAWLYPEGQLMSFVAAGHVTIPEAFGTPGIHMSLANSEKRSPFNVLHEFGHYGLGLGDEYKGVQPGTNIVTETLRCEAKAASAACIGCPTRPVSLVRASSLSSTEECKSQKASTRMTSRDTRRSS
jgi:hypothetical protein